MRTGYAAMNDCNLMASVAQCLQDMRPNKTSSAYRKNIHVAITETVGWPTDALRTRAGPRESLRDNQCLRQAAVSS